jgi:pimeloyl-ACP methyl ester carboxylesterase
MLIHGIAFGTVPMSAIAADILPSNPPALRHSARELRVVMEAVGSALFAAPKKRRRAASSRVVMVIPGFLASDASTWMLRRYLAACGFDVHPWNLGRNRGPRGDTVARLGRRIRQLSRDTGQPVQLVGWSLGGLLARAVAARTRSCVSRVIALGSPLAGNPDDTRLGALFSAVSGRKLEERGMKELLKTSFSVPVVSVYSRTDGVVGWRSSAYPEGECEAIEVDSSHLGMVVNREVLEVVGNVLSRPAVALDALAA